MMKHKQPYRAPFLLFVFSVSAPVELSILPGGNIFMEFKKNTSYQRNIVKIRQSTDAAYFKKILNEKGEISTSPPIYLNYFMSTRGVSLTCLPCRVRCQ